MKHSVEHQQEAPKLRGLTAKDLIDQVKAQQNKGLPDSMIKIENFGYSQTTYSAYEKDLANKQKHQGETEFHMKYKQDTEKQKKYLSDQQRYKDRELHMFDQL